MSAPATVGQIAHLARTLREATGGAYTVIVQRGEFVLCCDCPELGLIELTDPMAPERLVELLRDLMVAR